MPFQTLIEASALIALERAAAPIVTLDCSFDLSDPGSGQRAFAAAHLPGARYLNLDRDLAGAKNGRNGRHPLPTREDLAATVGRFGVAPGVQVIVYDAQGGPYGARAWWLLRWLGHAEVALLDGGPAAYVAAGGQLVGTESDAGGAREEAGRPYPPRPPAMAVIDSAALLATLGRVTVLDARSPERFRGEVEPLDPVAGHIPGAHNRFFKNNLRADGHFKAAAQLRQEFLDAGVTPGDVIHQCGSGVTACHNLLAMVHAGFEPTPLYPGSWSEWCSDPLRPVARG